MKQKESIIACWMVQILKKMTRLQVSVAAYKIYSISLIQLWFGIHNIDAQNFVPIPNPGDLSKNE